MIQPEIAQTGEITKRVLDTLRPGDRADIAVIALINAAVIVLRTTTGCTSAQALAEIAEAAEGMGRMECGA